MLFLRSRCLYERPPWHARYSTRTIDRGNIPLCHECSMFHREHSVGTVPDGNMTRQSHVPAQLLLNHPHSPLIHTGIQPSYGQPISIQLILPSCGQLLTMSSYRVLDTSALSGVCSKVISPCARHQCALRRVFHIHHAKVEGCLHFLCST